MPPTDRGMASMRPRSCSAPPWLSCSRPSRTPQVEAPRERCSISSSACAFGANQPHRVLPPNRRPACARSCASSAFSTSMPSRATVCCNRQLDVRQTGEIVDAVFAEMIRTHVGDDRGVGPRNGDSAAQNAAACGFENGRFGAALAHDHPGAGGAGIISHRERFIVEEYTVGAVVARPPAVGPRAGGEQAHRGGLPVGSRDDRRRDVPQRRPRNRRSLRQCRERKAPPARARP